MKWPHTNSNRDEFKERLRALQPLDLLLFRSSDPVSDGISRAQRLLVGDGSFSHVGMVVDRASTGLRELVPGVPYVLESTVGGVFGKGVFNTEGEAFLGVQMRRLDHLLLNCKRDGGIRIATAPLRRNPWDSRNTSRAKTRRRLAGAVAKYHGARYDANCVSLLSALLPALRPCAAKLERWIGTQDWMFCSELVASVYRDLGVLPQGTAVSTVLPMDFVHAGDKIPIGLFDPPRDLLNPIDPL